MLINNRTSHSANRWVELRDDGTAVAFTESHPFDLHTETRDGKQVQTIRRLPAKVIERPISFKDEAELRKIAYKFVRTGALDNAVPTPAVADVQPTTEPEAPASEPANG